MKDYRPLAEIVNDLNLEPLGKISIRKFDRSNNTWIKEIKVFYISPTSKLLTGDVDFCEADWGKENCTLVEGIRLVHFPDGSLKDGSHKESYRRHKDLGLLIPFIPTDECNADFYYLIKS